MCPSWRNGVSLKFQKKKYYFLNWGEKNTKIICGPWNRPICACLLTQFFTGARLINTRGSRKFCQRGSNSTLKTLFFLVDDKGERGSKIPLKAWVIIGPLAKRHLNGVLLVGWWWPVMEYWLGSFVIFQGIRTRIAKKNLYFCDFPGGSGPPVPPLDPPMYKCQLTLRQIILYSTWNSQHIRFCFLCMSAHMGEISKFPKSWTF